MGVAALAEGLRPGVVVHREGVDLAAGTWEAVGWEVVAEAMGVVARAGLAGAEAVAKAEAGSEGVGLAAAGLEEEDWEAAVGLVAAERAQGLAAAVLAVVARAEAEKEKEARQVMGLVTAEEVMDMG